MRELQVDLQIIRDSLGVTKSQTHTDVRVSGASDLFVDTSIVAGLRRCYISDAQLRDSIALSGVSAADLIATRIPDPGSVMAGDFAELVAAFAVAALKLPSDLIMPKKWQLKQDRTKPAPHSDVIQFEMPRAPSASTQDEIHCAEVKSKATASNMSQIENAIRDSGRDRTGRLAKTLVWLRERSFHQDLGTTTTEILQRFIDLTEYEPIDKTYYAVAVIDSSLVDDEVAAMPTDGYPEGTLVVIAIDDLKAVYEDVYQAVLEAWDQ